MKLLLTSAGIVNQTIAQAVVDLVGLPKDKIKVIFIPTATNVEEGDKGWLINDLTNFQQQGYQSVDIVDIAAVPQSIWQPRLEAANLICFGGGNEQFLAQAIRESGLKEVLLELLKTRVYMGISAGSMVAGEFLSPDQQKIIYPEDNVEDGRETGLGYTQCVIIPHLNSTYFPCKRKEILETIKGLNIPLYALDDQSALKIENDKIEVISEGEYLLFNN
jgi:dipeptidase E